MSQKRTFSSVYNAMLDVHAGMTVSESAQKFIPGQDTGALLNNFGHLTLGHLPPLLGNHALFAQPVAPDLITPAIGHALHDRQFQGVLKDIDPDYVIDPANVTFGLLGWLSCIQSLALEARIAEFHMNDFLKGLKALNDPQEYQRALSLMKKSAPHLVDSAPATMPSFIITGEHKPDNIVKDIASASRKAKIKANGNYDVCDELRTTVTLADDQIKGLTTADYIQGRNGIAAMFIPGLLGIEPHQIKDLYSETVTSIHKRQQDVAKQTEKNPAFRESRDAMAATQKLKDDLWIASMFRGISYYAFDAHTQFGIRVELQDNVYKDSIIDLTASLRRQEREALKRGRRNDVAHAARSELKRQEMKNNMPDFYRQMENPDFSDPTYATLQDSLLEAKAQNSRKPHTAPVQKCSMKDPNALRMLLNPKKPSYKTFRQAVTPL